MIKRFLLTLLIILTSGLMAVAVSAATNTYSASPGVAIPDAGGSLICNSPSTPVGSVTSTITVADSFTIADLNVALNITHSYVGDLGVRLTSPAGTTVTLVDQPGMPGSCFGFGSDNIITTLDDESGSGSVENADPPTGASYTPNNPLSVFDGQDVNGTWTLTVIDQVTYSTGILNSWSLIVGDGAGAAPGATVQTTSNDDPDGDGISGDRDNCPYDYNPDQEDGWGSLMGDVCDTEWYNRVGQGMSGFVQKSQQFHLHGNCSYMADGDPRCPVIASFDPATFTPGDMPMNVETDAAGTWSVVIHYLHSNNGADVYQVNTYNTNPPQPDTLVDDRLEIHVTSSSWRWYMRGGSNQYQGGSYGTSDSSSGGSSNNEKGTN